MVLYVKGTTHEVSLKTKPFSDVVKSKGVGITKARSYSKKALKHKEKLKIVSYDPRIEQQVKHKK